MGFLLKEALKMLCGLNQWSYAVFWKIGCQNPKLLIWEECYYEPSSCSAPHISGSVTFGEWEGSCDSPQIRSSQHQVQAGDKVHSLINVMMINSQVNVVGEGIVGRAAITGNHQWILSNNHTRAVHPPEVLNEVNHQFSAGMQTLVVIPILPHGVVQLGSSLSCSIDALLERTIKHMLFLQSVTNHADKLKRTGNSKIVCNKGGLLLKDNFEGGTTWAYEVGSQSMACPITVEDLNQPHQMLVEMLFEERGFFLEIAEIIRGLGLTILKGVMEARSDKIWACFAVETNRDIARMEIFLPLVQLLEQNAKVSAASANAIDDNNTMVHQSFPQAVPIATTGRLCSLQ